jgi:hypothetical protein
VIINLKGGKVYVGSWFQRILFIAFEPVVKQNVLVENMWWSKSCPSHWTWKQRETGRGKGSGIPL